MFVRQGSFEVLPGKLAALRETYARDCVPIVRAAPGNLDVYLLEPADGAGPVIACTSGRPKSGPRLRRERHRPGGRHQGEGLLRRPSHAPLVPPPSRDGRLDA